MTGPVVPFGDRFGMTDHQTLLARAILDLLGEGSELYPSTIAGQVRRRHPGLDPAGVRPMLERLFAERRVARLWHRYLLPGDVPAVREKWLAMIDRQRDRLTQDLADGHAWQHARALLLGWDGWRLAEDDRIG